MRGGWLIVGLGLGLGGCGERPRSSAAPAGAASFSREAFAPDGGDAGATDLPVPTTPDPRALDEILAAAARVAPGDGGLDHAALGSDTGLPADAGVRAAPRLDTPKIGRVHVGSVVVEPGMSSPAIERAARAQLYWPLVQRCRAADGAILPPEVVHLRFHLDRDGYVVAATILAVAKEPRFEDAARCMARELAMATFRAPAGARGLPQVVATDVPSVD
jgi:hypothetical protein